MSDITSDGNKTKMLRPRPRPIKQQQDYITKKTLLLQHARLLSKIKITLCKKRQKVITTTPNTSYVWHCFCTYCTKNTGVYYISALSCHTAPVGHNSVGSKTKSIRPRPRPRPVWDQSCHKTAVSDPKTGSNMHVVQPTNPGLPGKWP